MEGKPRIVNIVATGRFPFELDIEKLFSVLDLAEKSYEPEVYPGLLVKVGEGKHHVTLYRNGKYIITGVSSRKELISTYNEIYKKLKESRCFTKKRKSEAEGDVKGGKESKRKAFC